MNTVVPAVPPLPLKVPSFRKAGEVSGAPGNVAWGEGVEVVVWGCLKTL